jgi:TonB-linked SusC/RagA family outer membrane protein
LKISKLHRATLLLIALFSSTLGILSQPDYVVKGKVLTSPDSIPLPGVNILNNSGQGTITNAKGEFSTSINSPNDSLSFSSIGYKQQTIPVNGRKYIRVVLRPKSYQVDEVVVTALGIRKSQKALGYATQTVSSDELEKSSEKSLMNSLQGKVSGVDISSASGSPGASTRVIIRGMSSLSGSNQPLFVIDGIPVSNSFTGSASINGGTDFGNRINDISPENIESTNVLKGAAATALYGSRAANGAIIITTKSGRSGTSSVVFNSSFSFSHPLKLIKYQNKYGQGIFGNAVPYENMSWGARFDRAERIWGNRVDDSYRIKPYSGLPENVRDFFETGRQYRNSLAFSGGNKRTSYYLSYSNVSADGIFPTVSDSYKRHNIRVKGSHQFTDKLTVRSSISYIKKDNSSVPTGQGFSSVYNQIMQTPRDISLLELEDLDNPFNNIDNFYSQYTVNPYFILKNNGNKNLENRGFGKIEMNYALGKHLSLSARVGGDVSFNRIKIWQAQVEPEGNNEFSPVYNPGSVGLSDGYNYSLNSDVFIEYNRRLDNFDFSGHVAHHLEDHELQSKSMSIEDLVIPGFYDIDNSTNPPFVSEYRQKKQIVGVSGSFNISYQSAVFLALTARNDWSSTLPDDKNSFFYPSTALSFVFSEVTGTSDFFSFGKIRLSWARAGNDAPPYNVYNVFRNAGHSDGYGGFRFPLARGVHSFETSTLLGNPDLKHEMSEEVELGADIRFWKGRLGIDFAVYHRTITDLIWSGPLSYASGYSSQTTNLGKIRNRGVELLLTATPVKKSNFKWNTSLSFSKNNNKLVYLNDNLDKVVITGISADGGQQISLVGIPGKSLGIFEGRTAMYTTDGKMVVDNQGIPKVAEEPKQYGSSDYDFVCGWNNNLSWGNFSFSLTFDLKYGGKMYSRTKDISAWAGTSPVTLYNNREPFIIPNAVYEIGEDEKGNPKYAPNTIPLDPVALNNYWGNGGSEIDGFSLIDKSYLKLREASVYYNLPFQFETIGIKSIRLGVSGRNLWLWTPKNQYYIDPEITTFGNDIEADFGEYGATPSVRTFSFNLKVKF